MYTCKGMNIHLCMLVCVCVNFHLQFWCLCLFLQLYRKLSMYSYMFLSMYHSVHLSICLPISTCVYLSIYLSIYLFLPLHTSQYQKPGRVIDNEKNQSRNIYQYRTGFVERPIGPLFLFECLWSLYWIFFRGNSTHFLVAQPF